MKSDLEGPAPTPLDRLLVGEIIACWMELSFAQLTLSLPDQSLPEERHRVHHDEVAQSKYLAAVTTLNTVRALRPLGMQPTSPLKVFDGRREQA